MCRDGSTASGANDIECLNEIGVDCEWSKSSVIVVCVRGVSDKDTVSVDSVAEDDSIGSLGLQPGQQDTCGGEGSWCGRGQLIRG